jgi:hypothetical protein
VTYFLLVFFVLGAVVSGPAWMAYALKQDAERREWKARARERQLRKEIRELDERHTAHLIRDVDRNQEQLELLLRARQMGKR